MIKSRLHARLGGESLAVAPPAASLYQHQQDTHTNNTPKPLLCLESSYFYKKSAALNEQARTNFYSR